jgi:hypothetical protein
VSTPPAAARRQPDHLDVGLVPPTLISSRNHPPTIERLMALLRDHLSADDQDKIRRAYDFAAAAHEGQIRQSGDP